MTAPRPRDILRMALISARTFVHLVRNGSVHRTSRRRGRAYAVEGAGTYFVFRETVNDVTPPGEPVVLVVGFRLRVITSFRLPHWCFQRICLLTTPFWAGLPGFSVRLWMVSTEHRGYLGIYDWRGEEHARRYADALVRVLKPISTPGSVWYRLLPNHPLEPFLDAALVQ